MVVSEHLQKFLVVLVDVFCSFGASKVVTECCIFIHTIKRKPQRHHVQRSENPIFKIVSGRSSICQRRGRQPQKWGGNLLLWQFFPKNCMKMKKGPLSGTRVLGFTLIESAHGSIEVKQDK